MKSNEFKSLVNDISKCNKCLNLGDKSLINFYGSEMSLSIPSIWTDWLNHLDSEVMIIGQDWGPYKDMLNIYERYKNGEKYEKLIQEEKSLTKRNLFKFLSLTNENYNLNKIYITNAIMCARSGSNYRSNNINLKYSTTCCSKFLKRQIDIVKPKVIVTLGYYPLLSLSNIFGFCIEKNLTETILNTPVIKTDDYIIIPVYHPAAQISVDRQIEQYKKIWENL